MLLILAGLLMGWGAIQGKTPQDELRAVLDFVTHGHGPTSGLEGAAVGALTRGGAGQGGSIPSGDGSLSGTGRLPG